MSAGDLGSLEVVEATGPSRVEGAPARGGGSGRRALAKP